MGSTCCSTAPTAPPTAWRPRSSGASARASPRLPMLPMAATSTPAAAQPTCKRSRSRSSRAGTPSVFRLDGDGDRVLAAIVLARGGRGRAAALPRCTCASRRLSGDGVVVTVMTQYGFHRAMEQAGVAVATANVGDRYVLEELRQRGWTLGGEQSGHIIDMGFNRTGDGIAGALLTLEATRRAGPERARRARQAATATSQRARARSRRARACPGGCRGGAFSVRGARRRGRVLVRSSRHGSRWCA